MAQKLPPNPFIEATGKSLKVRIPKGALPENSKGGNVEGIGIGICGIGSVDGSGKGIPGSPGNVGAGALASSAVVGAPASARVFGGAFVGVVAGPGGAVVGGCTGVPIGGRVVGAAGVAACVGTAAGVVAMGVVSAGSALEGKSSS